MSEETGAGLVSANPRGRLVRLGVNFLGFQSVWFACVVGAGQGLVGLGPLAAVLWLGLHLFLSRRAAEYESGRSKADEIGIELKLFLAAALIGGVLDSLLNTASLIAFPAHARLDIASLSISPPWMIVLWGAFATTLRHSLDWMRRRYALALCAGAIFGPLAYLAGERLGAIDLAPSFQGPLAVAVVWGSAMPALLRLRERLDGRPSYPMRSLAGDGR
ncbi:DUF2878 domain-containing protein [Thioalkalivibrio sp. HK1]|uniref:DUF2878 domain-containing protein n=1 Tax=Thioalkalivibrio sp. HK1 TaxID=1469245 RepID=UPI00046FA8A0|nr:DUF2878 domain-containing protein [Thioalkalivibrio sp. HK1]